ncbi:coxsackievirus and adenovirus receptor-like [Notamacropus eugenii]|uniref:coxsackievirus and adenovirus receptor-like n=1 Tax=Notamacropus eugenii TaxID=9315 RepID=UPI003B679AD3
MKLLLCIILLCWTMDMTRSVTITTTGGMFEKVKGETIPLPFKFTIAPEDQEPLHTEWIKSPADNQKVEQGGCPSSKEQHIYRHKLHK